MSSKVNRLAALFLLPLVARAQSVPSNSTSIPTETASKPAVSKYETVAPISAVLLETIRHSSEANLGNAPGGMLGAAHKQELEQGIDEAYLEAHRTPAEDVTNLQDGTDRVYRIKTSLGLNVCLNYRDKDRFDPGKGKTIFAGVCNR